jgi:hypothetical protein
MLAAAGSHIQDANRVPVRIQTTIQTAETTQNTQ